MATETAMNAKWYHIVSEKIRVRSTSNKIVASATNASPNVTVGLGLRGSLTLRVLVDIAGVTMRQG